MGNVLRAGGNSIQSGCWRGRKERGGAGCVNQEDGRTWQGGSFCSCCFRAGAVSGDVQVQCDTVVMVTAGDRRSKNGMASGYMDHIERLRDKCQS